MKKAPIVLLLCAALAACSGNSSPVGLVDVARLTANWPAFNDAQKQLADAERQIVSQKASQSQKQHEAAALEKKYAAISQHLVDQVRSAATKIAQQRNLKLVLTREFVGYGGVDITPDVEKALGITETASPSASP